MSPEELIILELLNKNNLVLDNLSLAQIFEALFLLHAQNPSAINGEALSAILKLLISRESIAGGPYRSAESPDSIIVIDDNLAIQKFLKSQDVSLEPLDSWLLQQNCLAIPEFKITSVINEDEERIYNNIIAEINDLNYLLPEALANETQKALNKIISFDTKRWISLEAYRVNQAFSWNTNDNILIKLGVANLLLWSAYTIYDDFLDQEGQPSKLPAANYCLYQLSIIYSQILPNDLEIFTELMNIMENKNILEAIHGGSTDFNLLYEKSLPHCLPALSLAIINNKKNLLSILTNIFKNYLNARQLDDDAHDWQEDLQANRQTPVVQRLLEMAALKNITPKNQEALNKLFWLELLPEFAKGIEEFCNQAKELIINTPEIKNPEILINMLEVHYHSAQKALKERQRACELIASW